MYENIGNKIKGLAKFLFIIAAIVFLIIGFVLLSLNGELLAISLILIFFGPLIAWISSWILYGFGQLIENTSIIAQQYNTKNNTLQKTVTEESEYAEKQPCDNSDNVTEHVQDDKEYFVFTEEDFIDFNCPNCETKLSFTKEQLQNNNNFKCPLCDTTLHISV